MVCKTWKKLDQVRLILFQDGIDVGIRGYLPDSVEVKPGEKYTFIINDFQAPSKESTLLEYQMLVEGVSLFGERKSVEVIIK